MDKEKIRKFARLIAVGTEISIVARDLKVSERTLRRWRKNPIFIDELGCLNQQRSKEAASLASQLQSTALRWAISYLYSSAGKDSVKAHIVGKVLARPVTAEKAQYDEAKNSEAFQKCLEIVDSLASMKRRYGDRSDG